MNQSQAVSEGQTPRAKLPSSIWALGFVSMFMDISSEMIHGLLPTFLVTVLGASAEMVGLIEGVGEATASISKLFLGWISDRLGKRKALTVLGYGLGALSKPLFALAPTASGVLVAAAFGPHRRGHPRRSSRCVGRRPCAAGIAWGGVWAPAVARYRRRLSRSAPSHGADGVVPG